MHKIGYNKLQLKQELDLELEPELKQESVPELTSIWIQN